MTSPIVDPHASRISPDDPRLRPRKPKVRALHKGPTMIVLSIIVVALAATVIQAIEPRTKQPRDRELSQLGATNVPREILTSPDYVPLEPPASPPLAAIDAGTPENSIKQPLHDVPAATTDSTHERADRGAFSREGLRKQRIEAYWRARSADIFIDTKNTAEIRSDPDVEADEHPTHQALTELAAMKPTSADDELVPLSAGKGDGYLRARLRRPRSPYELKAGTIIPAVLQTAINSDLAGPVFAKVREAVYDSITHEHLLIPQNTTLVAAYDARVAWGQERVVLCWQRLILPNGNSLQLECMPGGDLKGAAGLTDEVDEHWLRLAKGAALASLLSAATTAVAGDTTGYYPTVPQQFAQGAATEFGRAGSQIVRRDLNVKPTITIRPGWSMNVLVTQDMILEPYIADQPHADDSADQDDGSAR